MQPKGNPIAVPRSHAPHERFQSAAVIHTAPFTLSTVSCTRCSLDAAQSVSPTAKRPTATVTTSIPSISWGTLNA